MKPILSLLAAFLLATNLHAQCDFQTDKDEPGYKFIKESVGPTLLQWTISLGVDEKNNPVVWVRIVDGGARNKNFTPNDAVILSFDNGDAVTLNPKEDIEPTFIYTGTMKNTHYFTRFAVSKDVMKKLAEQKLGNVTAIVNGRDMEREVKKRQKDDIMRSAACALNL